MQDGIGYPTIYRKCCGHIGLPAIKAENIKGRSGYWGTAYDNEFSRRERKEKSFENYGRSRLVAFLAEVCQR
jgi:hypothetical protein